MALVFADRVKETTNTIGGGTLSLGGALPSFQKFEDGIGVGNQCYYTITNSADNTWEVGIGTLVAAGSLQRDTVLSSSNGGSTVAFTAGTKTVFAAAPAAFFTGSLTTTSHSAINHAGIPGVNSFDVAAHSATNHTGIPGVLSTETFDQAAHTVENHSGLPGVPGTATSGPGGATEGTITADSNKGLQIVGGVLESKLSSNLTFDGSGNIDLSSSLGYVLPFVLYWENIGTSNAPASVFPGILPVHDTVPSMTGSVSRVTATDVHPVPISGSVSSVVLYSISGSEDPLSFDAGTSTLSVVVNGSPTAINVSSNTTMSPGTTSVINFPSPVSVSVADRLTLTFSGRASSSSKDILLYCAAVISF